MDNRVFTSSEIMMQISNYISVDGNKLPSVWKDVVSKIHSYKDEGEDNEKRMPIGERLAGNTRVVDYKNKTLLIETDHPGWIQYLKLYQKFIITGLSRVLPDIEVKHFAFRVAGSNVMLRNNYEDDLKKENQAMEKSYEKTEGQLNQFYQNQKKPASPTPSNLSRKSEDILPEDLLKRFENMKNSMKE